MRVAPIAAMLAAFALGCDEGGTCRILDASASAPRHASAPFVEVSGDLASLDVPRFPPNAAFHERLIGGGIVAEDLDEDGHLDLYASGGVGNNVLAWGNADGSFSVCEDEVPAVADAFTLGVSAADYDNDGDTDLLVLNRGSDRLLRNLGDRRFEDVTLQAGLGGESVSTSASWADFDADGWLDVLVTTASRSFVPTSSQLVLDHPVLWRNAGDGSFTAVQMPFPAGSSYVASVADLDDDVDPDIFLTQEFGSTVVANRLYRNDGVGNDGEVRWTDVTSACGCEVPHAAMGVSMLDYDRDGREDLFVTNLWGATPAREVLLRNLGQLRFEDVAETAGAHAMDPMTRRAASWGTASLDVENDGDDDLYVAYGHFPTTRDFPFGGQLYAPSLEGQPNALLINDDGRFNLELHSGADDAGQGRGVVAADLDADGCLDLVLANQDGPMKLLRNRCLGAGHWLGVRLRGTTSNRDAIGAKVTVTTEHGTATKTVVGCSTSVHSCAPKRLHFGLGTASAVTALEIRWPDGTFEHHVPGTLDTLHTFVQGDR